MESQVNYYSYPLDTLNHKQIIHSLWKPLPPISLLFVYVDDLILAGTSIAEITQVKQLLND